MASLNPKCRNCGLWKTAGTVCVAGDGPPDAEVVVIGEAPGRSEARTGRPFTGESGRILRAELRKNKLESVYITNVVKCRPPDNRAPTPDEIKACKPYLEQELKDVQPDYVLSVGVPATKVMFRGKAKINQCHGELIENPKVDYIGMPTYHPAYTMRDPSKLPGFQQDIKRLASVVHGEQQDQAINWNVVRRGNFREFIRQFTEAKEFAFDCETPGLFPHNGGYIVALGIALPNCTWVIPGFMHPDFQIYSHSPWRHGLSFIMLVQLLAHKARIGKKKAYAWNGKFDNLWLRRVCGVSFRLSFDGMLAAHTLNENTANDLTSNCRTFLHESEYDIPLKEKQGKSKKPSLNWMYCAKDATFTLRLKHVFEEELRKNLPLRRLFYKLVMPAARTMEDIEREGLTIDLERMNEVGLDLLQNKIQTRARLNELVGGAVNWNSSQQVSKVLYTDLKLKSKIKTDKGKPSTSEEALLDLMGKHEVVDLLLKYRELAKFLSTYIVGFKQYMVGDKLYVSYKLHGTVTGRYSSRIHSIPRDGSIRNLVTAPSGWRFVQGDISQAELRIAAVASGDLEMRRCFTEDIDVHWRTLMHTLSAGGVGEYARPLTETASELAGHKLEFPEAVELMMDAGHNTAISVWGGWKEGRKKAKAVNFGFIYGMYEKKFIQTAKVKYGWEPTYDEAHQARQAYFSLYSGIPRWHDKQKKLARIDGYVKNLAGRLRRLPGINGKDRSVRSEAERQAINSPIQGFIGDYKAMVMVEIHETIDHDKFRLVGEHHDAVLGIVREGCEDETLPQVLSILRKPSLLKDFKISLGIPMEGEVEVGPWGAGKEYHETK